MIEFSCLSDLGNKINYPFLSSLGDFSFRAQRSTGCRNPFRLPSKISIALFYRTQIASLLCLVLPLPPVHGVPPTWLLQSWACAGAVMACGVPRATRVLDLCVASTATLLPHDEIANPEPLL